MTKDPSSFPVPPYLLMFLFEEINTTNKITSVAAHSRGTLISDAGCHIFEPLASCVVNRQKEGPSNSLQRRQGTWGERGTRVCSVRMREEQAGMEPAAP